VKVFPGSSVGGPDFVKSVLGPMPWTRIMPTGGVEASESSLRTWFGAGIVACGIGSNLITKELLDTQDYDGIERKVRDTVQLIKTIRTK
jgi:2-dehydro-3-deoxyphosphogluconate aldolase/(4S)-4-hydroxy-2-oxoglutarate aldolase